VPSPILEEDLTAVLAVLEQRPEGARRAEIAGMLTPKPAPRTLQFWLRHLVDAGRLVKEGEARATRYSLPETRQDSAAPASAVRAGAEEAVLPLSEASEAIRIPPAGCSAAYRGVFQPDAGDGRSHRRSIRASVIHHGAVALSATVRRRQ